jgi:hypothetical protein
MQTTHTNCNPENIQYAQIAVSYTTGVEGQQHSHKMSAFLTMNATTDRDTIHLHIDRDPTSRFTLLRELI